jgi:hypothetical protein
MATISETIYKALPPNCPDKLGIEKMGIKFLLASTKAFCDGDFEVKCLGYEDREACIKCLIRIPSYTVMQDSGQTERIDAKEVRYNPVDEDHE